MSGRWWRLRRGPGSADGASRLRRRRNLLIAVVAAAAIAAGGGLLLASTIKSPAEQAAQTSAPPPTQLTAPVTRQVITSTVLAQGAVHPPPEVAQLSGADSGGSGPNGELPVVTRVFRPAGSIVEPGQPIVEVAGRPLFALRGSVPAYRNLVPGETGTDVSQLQLGLESLGYPVGSDTPGTFGAGTAAAVSAFYTALGYPVPAQQATVATAKGGKKSVAEPMVPLSEVIFVPRFPARVVKVAGPVGQEASGSLVTLSVGSPSIAGQLSPGNAALVRPGMRVQISDAATGLSRAGRIASVGARSQTKGSISGGVYLPMKVVPSRPLGTALAGHDVTLTITAARSAGPELAVPEAAVFARADGRLYVTRTGHHGNVTVPVRVLGTGDGLVGVRPERGSLAPGDRVVIGTGYARGLS